MNDSRRLLCICHRREVHCNEIVVRTKYGQMQQQTRAMYVSFPAWCKLIVYLQELGPQIYMTRQWTKMFHGEQVPHTLGHRFVVIWPVTIRQQIIAESDSSSKLGLIDKLFRQFSRRTR